MEQKNSPAYGLSFVMVVRNDDYGGDFRERLQRCIGSLYAQLDRYAVTAEIVCVNYNPLPAPDIESFIEWPRGSRYVDIKIVTVPPEVHRAFVAEHGLREVPVVEYLGKNVGLRRASGTFVACMNPDIIFTDAAIKKMRRLSAGYYYKADRLDFTLRDGTMEYVRFHTKGHSFATRRFSALLNAWWRIKYAVLNFYKYHTVYIKWILDFLKLPVYTDRVEFRYHCMASGDFILMHRESWASLEGYRETAYISLHVDALMVVQAARSGLREKVLRQPVYHREHGRRYRAEDADPEYREAYLYFQREARKMAAAKKNTIYNKPGWGLALMPLPVAVIK